MNEQEKKQYALIGLVVAGIGFILYRTGTGVKHAVTNPFQTTSKATRGLLRDAKQATAGNLDFLAGSTDETIGRTFDDKAGGGLGEMANNFTSSLPKVKLPKVKTPNVGNVTKNIQNTFNNVTPDIPKVKLPKAGNVTNDIESTWNKSTPDVNLGNFAPNAGKISDTINNTVSNAEQTWNKVTPDIPKIKL